MPTVPLQVNNEKGEVNLENINTKKILENLQSSGYLIKVLEHHSVITMDDVARTLDIPVDSTAKTILLSQEKIGLIAVVLCGKNKVDYSKVANVLHVPRKTVKIAELSTLTSLGLNPGEVCPFFGFFQKTIVDTTLLTQPFVYCGSGNPQKTIKISPEEMVKATNATVANVSQPVSDNKQF